MKIEKRVILLVNKNVKRKDRKIIQNLKRLLFLIKYARISLKNSVYK